MSRGRGSRRELLDHASRFLSRAATGKGGAKAPGSDSGRGTDAYQPSLDS
jgi:hypothetical protein